MNAADSEQLIELATMLEKKAKLNDARAALIRDRIGCDDDVIKEVSHADWCRQKAALLRRLAGPKIRSKALALIPTAAEWTHYATVIGWREADAQACFDHFQSNGWKIGGKTLVRDWKAAARNGHRRWLEKNPRAADRKTTEKSDHPKWSAWLKLRNLPYEKQANALPYMHEEFAKWLKENP